MQKTIDVKAEIRYEGKWCGDLIPCYGFVEFSRELIDGGNLENLKKIALCVYNFHKDGNAEILWEDNSNNKFLRCRACLEKTGDVCE